MLEHKQNKKDQTGFNIPYDRWLLVNHHGGQEVVLPHHFFQKINPAGQVAIVSKMLNRRYIGFEIVKEYYEFAKERLQEGTYRIKEKEKNPKNNSVGTLFGIEG